jgi:hypothetical protein
VLQRWFVLLLPLIIFSGSWKAEFSKNFVQTAQARRLFADCNGVNFCQNTGLFYEIRI